MKKQLESFYDEVCEQAYISALHMHKKLFLCAEGLLIFQGFKKERIFGG